MDVIGHAIPRREGYLIYHCNLCHTSWARVYGVGRLDCGVLHAPGSCCHFNEVVINDANYISLETFLDGLLSN